MDIIQFSPIKQKELENYASSAYVFNTSRENILKEVIRTASFSDERLGSSDEDVTVAIATNKGKWRVLPLTNHSGEIVLQDVLENKRFSKVLVIVRRMSSMVLDKVKSNFSCYILSSVHKDFAKIDIPKYASIKGELAKNRIYLNIPFKEVKIRLANNQENNSFNLQLLKDITRVHKGD